MTDIILTIRVRTSSGSVKHTNTQFQASAKEYTVVSAHTFSRTGLSIWATYWGARNNNRRCPAMVTNWEVEPYQREGRKGEEKIAESGEKW